MKLIEFKNANFRKAAAQRMLKEHDGGRRRNRRERKNIIKNKVVAALSLLVVLAALLPAGVFCQEEGSYYEETAEYVELYNENLDNIPGIVKRLFANERINFHIALEEEGEEVIGVVTSSTCAITEFTEGSLENPTLKGYIQAETIEEVKANPTEKQFLAAINEIRIEGVGFFKKIKVAFLNLIRTVSGWFM